MNGAKCAACLVAVLFVLFAFVVKGAKSIICYKCNSRFDERCGDPFIPYNIGQVDCNITEKPSHLIEYNPVICRKSIQRIHRRVQIVRDCGYIEDQVHDNEDCYSRLGSHDTEVTHCSCTMNLCNGSGLLEKPYVVVLIASTAVMGHFFGVV
ncbi:uncharacterized protein LOC126902473 [Daktulosphaira vitifoliae]|uniref:uncharacterized protein LOC126902473 n=1 Tax=Daktulosphaira vitifoliae TaxID=58002 RepID=UPI0021A98EC5|nr:uncharacterized protein LOC126902473 [Daktulosphaira vitifoliae]